MNRRTHSLWLPIMLALLLGMILSGALLSAQQQPSQPNQQSPSQPMDQGQQPGSQPQPGQAPGQAGQPAPESQAQSQQTQIFSGTIVKMGDKFVLQDDSGKTFDIDNQAAAQPHEGKRVRIQGTLDPDGKTIHVK